MSDQAPDAQAAAEEEDELSLLDLALTLARQKAWVAGSCLLAALGSLVYALAAPNIYTGTSRILPPQPQAQTGSMVLAQLAQLSGLAGGLSQAAGIRNPNDLYVGMLKSRTVADNLIERFDLGRLYDKKYVSQTRKKLADRTRITAGRDGIIAIEVEDEDPARAAALANGYVEELLKLTQVLAVTEASQRRLFFERQLEQARQSLARAEAATREALDKGGLVAVEGQGRVMAETSARLRAAITVKEIEISAMRAFASSENPDLRRLQEQLAAMRRELARLEGTSAGLRNGPHARTNPEAIENLRLLRELKYHEAIYELLAKQYEAAKIDEARDAAVVQVLDKAIPPDRKTKPRRTLIVALGTLVGLLVGILLAFGRAALERWKADPREGARLAELRRHFGRA